MYKIEIFPKEKRIDVSKNLYGLFFEDINRAGDGGLYAELLCNRAFEDGVIPADCEYNSATKTIVSQTGWESSFEHYEGEGIYGWENVAPASMALTDKNTLNPNRKRALSVSFCGGIIRNCGFMGVPVEKGKSYRFYMFAQSERDIAVDIMLTSEEGEIYDKKSIAVSGGYKKYECILDSAATDYNARLALASNSDETILIGFTSLFPVDTYKGRENGLRKSLAEKILDLKPTFLRFPGGCIVEGFTKETAHRFKDTIGPVWERKSHYLLWSYMATNGLGYHEYLQFCEDSGLDAMYVFNCGMTCQGRCPDYFDDELIEEFYEDAVSAIMYATAPKENEWGKRRADNGHPEPFTCLKYLEIGNENWGEEYNKRYKFFYEKLKEQFPQFTYISTDHTEKSGLRTEYVDEHFYSDPIFFAANTKMYDDIDRSSVDIYCGEYASTIGVKAGTLYGALGEAAFLTGIERNQDKVKMTSYAPLFKNVDYVSWEPDMIAFNNHEDYAIPSYYMLKMFAENRGDYICNCRVTTEADRRIEAGHFATDDGATYEGNAFSQDIKGDIHVRFWDRGLSGEDQNHYDLSVKDGVAKVVHYNGWSAEPICAEKEYELNNEVNHVAITVGDDSFKVMINNILLFDHVLGRIPHISAVSSVDEANNRVITKIVNFSEKEVSIRIESDVEMSSEAELITLTGDTYAAKNSFEEPLAVAPTYGKIEAARVFDLIVKPRSINVLSCYI